MKARIEQHRIGFRMIFLLIVQTVCLAALPNGTTDVQQVSGAVVCAELTDSTADAPEQNAGIRQNQPVLPVIAAASVILISCTACALPADRTPVLDKVRMDD